MPPEFSESELAELRDLLAQGRKLEAVKLYRELSGAGLPEAMAWVDAQPVSAASTNAAAGPRELDAAQQAELRRLLANEGEIAASKYYREQSGADFFEAIEFVDALLDHPGAAEPATEPGPLPPRELLDLFAHVESTLYDANSRERLAQISSRYSEVQLLMARKLARELHRRAYDLADACRDEKIRQSEIPALLAADCPGFSEGIYSMAIEEGFISSR